MKDSVTYQGIVEEIIKAHQDAVLRVGSRKFGRTSDAARTTLAGINDPDRLANLLDRLMDVATWDELLAAP